MRNTALSVLLSLLFIASGCPEQAGDDDDAGDDDAGDDDTGSDDDAGDDDTEDSDVVPPYDGLGGWTDCILDDGDDEYDASGAACGPGQACLMVGWLRVYEVPELADCSGVTATDALDAFEWECRDDGGSVRLVSVDLKLALHYLIDEDGVAWRPNQVIVEQDGSEVVRSEEAVWWSNDIELLPDNDGGGVAVLDAADTVYILTADAESDGYQIDADGIAVSTEDFDLTLDGAAGVNCNGLTGEDEDADLRCLISTGGQQCLWIEGNYGAATGDRTIHLADTHASILYDLSVWDSLDGVVLGYGSSHNAILDFWIGYTTNNGLVFDTADDNWADTALVEELGGDAVTLLDSNRNRFHWVSTEATGDDGWDLTNSHDNEFDGVWAYGTDQGFRLDGATGNQFQGTEAGWCTDAAYYLEHSSNDNVFVDLRGRENYHHGVLISNSTDNRFYGVRLMTSGQWGEDAWSMVGAHRTTVVDAVISGAGRAGFYTWASADVTVVELLTAWSHDDGFHASDGTVGLTLHQVTSVGHDEDGIEIHNTNMVLNTVVSGVVSASNYENGFNMDDSTTVRLVDVAACHNTYSGLDLTDMEDVSFHGTLWVGDNWDFDCETQWSNDPGLEHDTCANTGGSDATLVSDADLSSTFAGALFSDEPVNADDVAGLAAFDDIDDWMDFDNPYRAWGPDGAFPDPDYNTGPCDSGDDCRIWDWRLAASDPVLFDAHGALVDGGACPASAHGDVAITDFQTSPNTYLLHAVEIILDNIGDDDGLCESDETCLYVASPGAYVGEGEHDLVSCTFADGVVSNVTMYRMELWGA
jgi:hypothetical protein